ncbi:hypothetical protein EJB05_02490, partial [Eragrostis curvula]
MEARVFRKLAKKAAAVAANGGTPPPEPTMYLGVRLRPWSEWSAEIWDSPTTLVCLGGYDTAVEAACAYDAAARTLQPEDARTNFPEPAEVDKEERAAVVLAYFAGVKRKRAEKEAEAGGASSSKPSPAAKVVAFSTAPSPHFPNAIATPPSIILHHLAPAGTGTPHAVSAFYRYEPPLATAAPPFTHNNPPQPSSVASTRQELRTTTTGRFTIGNISPAQFQRLFRRFVEIPETTTTGHGSGSGGSDQPGTQD